MDGPLLLHRAEVSGQTAASEEEEGGRTVATVEVSRQTVGGQNPAGRPRRKGSDGADYGTGIRLGFRWRRGGKLRVCVCVCVQLWGILHYLQFLNFLTFYLQFR